MLTTSLNYRLIADSLPQRLDATAKTPPVAREIAYYLSNIGNVRSLNDFVGDRRIFEFAMRAHGLNDMTYAKAFIRKVLEGGIDSSDGLASRLADPRYREFAETFNFARYGTATTAFDRTQQGTVDRYTRQILETSAGQDNEGVRLALYFQRKAPQIRSLTGLLADRALLKVTQTTFNLPASMSTLSLEKQTLMIEQHLNIDDLRTPERLTRLLDRFTNMWDVANGNPTNTSAAVNLVLGRPVSLSLDLLGKLQTLRSKG
jgi:Protein of unknown function (DUF1217)